jgi:predicted dehydrogenase
MNKPVIFAQIGASCISQSQHIPNLLSSSYATLSVVCDVQEERLKEVRDSFGAIKTTTSFQEVLDDPEIEAVLIATGPAMHVPLTLQALAAGKHVYVEKPLAETVEECQQVIDMQKKTRRHVAVGFNRRMAPAYQKAKEILAATGGAKHVHYRLSDAYWIWGATCPPGLRLIHEVCHIFDILRFIIGSEVTSVYCVPARDDDETVVLRFESGAVASIMSSGFVHWDMPKEILEVITDRGAITVNEFVELNTYGLAGFEPSYCFAGHLIPNRDTIQKYLFAKRGFEALRDVRRICYENLVRLEELRKSGVETAERADLERFMAQNGSPHINYMVDKGWSGAIDNFAECIRTGCRSMLASPADGLAVAIITQAAVQSRETNEIVPVNIPD